MQFDEPKIDIVTESAMEDVSTLHSRISSFTAFSSLRMRGLL